jgi:hypothetical protein
LLVRQGKDPIDERDATKGAAAAALRKRVTFDQAAEAYLQKNEDGWKNAVHRQHWRNTWREHISPVLGKLDVALIDTAAVPVDPKLLDAIAFAARQPDHM